MALTHGHTCLALQKNKRVKERTRSEQLSHRHTRLANQHTPWLSRSELLSQVEHTYAQQYAVSLLALTAAYVSVRSLSTCVADFRNVLVAPLLNLHYDKAITIRRLANLILYDIVCHNEELDFAAYRYD